MYAIYLFYGAFICKWMHKIRLNQTLKQQGYSSLLCNGFNPLEGNPSELGDKPFHGRSRTLWL